MQLSKFEVAGIDNMILNYFLTSFPRLCCCVYIFVEKKRKLFSNFWKRGYATTTKQNC